MIIVGGDGDFGVMNYLDVVGFCVGDYLSIKGIFGGKF